MSSGTPERYPKLPDEIKVNVTLLHRQAPKQLNLKRNKHMDKKPGMFLIRKLDNNEPYLARVPIDIESVSTISCFLQYDLVFIFRIFVHNTWNNTWTNKSTSVLNIHDIETSYSLDNCRSLYEGCSIISWTTFIKQNKTLTFVSLVVNSLIWS